jgi:hypothetical protein
VCAAASDLKLLQQRAGLEKLAQAFITDVGLL